MIDTEKYVKIISSQTEKPKAAESVGVEINNQDITITENGVYTADAGYTGIGTAMVNVPEPVIQSLGITPTTSEQTITATGGVNGYSPITVDAVTSSIDANITAGNIKSGVSILGVTGNLIESNETGLSAAPTTSVQSFTPTSPYTGFNQVYIGAVTSSIDNNIKAENIKSGVSILGVEGSMTPAPDYYIEKVKNNSGLLQNTSRFLNLSSPIGVDTYALAYAYYKNTGITGTVDLSNFTTVEDFGCCSMLSGTNITSIKFGSGTTVKREGFSYVCSTCPELTTVDISFVPSMYLGAFKYAFRNCSALTNVITTGIIYVTNEIFNYAFEYCTALTYVDFPNLIGIGGTGGGGFYGTFGYCSSLITVKFQSARGAGNSPNLFNSCFRNCTSLQDVYYSALRAGSFSNYSNQFTSMLSGTNGVTLHFPKNLDPQTGDTTISALTGYPNFGGTNTVLAFDQPSTILLTGANTIVYERNPKKDTATALSWRVNNTYATSTPYYTTGLTDPTVGTTIYSDSACTTAVTTVDSIS